MSKQVNKSLSLQEPEPEVITVDAEAVPIHGAVSSSTNDGTEISCVFFPDSFCVWYLNNHFCVLYTAEQHNRASTTKANVDFVLCGDMSISGGRHIRPGRNVFVSLCGDTRIDLRKTTFPSGTELTFVIVRLCGDVRITVLPGTAVVLRRFLLCGDRRMDDDVLDSQDSSTPSISVTVYSLCGSIHVQSET